MAGFETHYNIAGEIAMLEVRRYRKIDVHHILGIGRKSIVRMQHNLGIFAINWLKERR